MTDKTIANSVMFFFFLSGRVVVYTYGEAIPVTYPVPKKYVFGK